MRFRPVIEPTSTLLTLHVSNRFHCSSIGAKLIGHDGPWPAIAFHRPLEKLEGCPAIPALGGENFERLAFVINAPLPDLGGEHRTEPVPSHPHRLMANIDATLEPQALDLPQR